MTESIGVFGGTFDPPHLGHLILAAEAQFQLKLSSVLWVLTPQPPHKPDRPITSMYQRLEMLRRSIDHVQGFELSTIEIDRPGPHYTIDTIDILQTRFPKTPLTLLIGGDSLHDLPKWHMPQELVTAVAALGVMRRPGDDIDLSELEKILPGLMNKIQYIDTPQLEISSTAIRERVSTGGPYRFYVPTPVYDYITQNRLYR
ncbi:MAG: nicotinate-nucleotide adenylyltransferase [Chloroflexota bacterium]